MSDTLQERMEAYQKATDAKIDGFASKLDEILKAVKPETGEPEMEITQKIDNMHAEMLSKFDDMESDIDDILMHQRNLRIEIGEEKYARIEAAQKAMLKQEPCNCETPEDFKFTSRMYKFLAVSLPATAVLTVLSFSYIISAFPIVFGLFMTLLGGAIWAMFDEFFFPGNSLKRISQDAKAIGLAVIAIAMFFGIGVSVANTYLSNPYGGGNENAPKVIIEQNIQQPTATTGQFGNSEQPTKAGQQLNSAPRGNDVVLPKRAGKPESEQ